MHTFDPRMIEMMMMRTSIGVLVKLVQMVIMTTIVQFSCNLLLPPHCGTFGKEIAGSKVPVGQSRLSLKFPVSSPPADGNKWPTPDATSVFVSRPRVSSRLQIPVSDCRLWVPGSGDPCLDPDQNCGGRRRQECHEPMS